MLDTHPQPSFAAPSSVHNHQPRPTPVATSEAGGSHHHHHSQQPQPQGSVPVWLPRGQTVAAQVPYTKRKQEWIVASVVSWNEEEMTYVVKDEFPENNKKMKSWTIPHHKVLRFPRDLRDPIMPGDRVLSLWYIPDTEEWSSMFYEATIVNSDDKARVWLRFNGDDEIYEIDSMKIVKKPKRRPVPKAASSSSATTSTTTSSTATSVASLSHKRPVNSTTHNNSTAISNNNNNNNNNNSSNNSNRINNAPQSGTVHSRHSPNPDNYAIEERPRRASSAAATSDQPPHKKQRITKTEADDQPPPAARNGTSVQVDSSSSNCNTTSLFTPPAIAKPSNGGFTATNGVRFASSDQPPREHYHAPVSAAMFNNRYQFCGVLGKKMKRMGAILNERSKVSNT